MDLTLATTSVTRPVQRLLETLRNETTLTQHGLLDARELARKCEFFDNHSPVDEDLVLSLWAHGLIRSDVSAPSSTTVLSASLDANWPEILAFKTPRKAKLRPLFHPYRVYSIWRIFKIAKSPGHPLRFPRTPERQAFSENWLEHIDGRESFVHRQDLIESINLIAELAITCEPFAFPIITSRSTYSLESEIEETRVRREAFTLQLLEELKRCDLAAIEEIRTELCRAAQRVDPNVRVQKLMRLAGIDTRQNLKGNLSVAVLFGEMAECIRRCAEDAFKIGLPEEDECGYLSWNRSARTELFGSSRPLDAPPRTWKPFLRRLGIDPGTRARVYVEGETEHGLFAELVGNYNHVEIINLRGSVTEKRKFAFRDALKNDITQQVFSFVVIDGDISENLRAAKAAARQEEFFGEVYISPKDLERGGFTQEQIASAIACFANEGGASPEDSAAIIENLDWSLSFDEISEELRSKHSCLRELKKGTKWGKVLASVIRCAPYPTEPDKLREEKQPIAKARGRIMMTARYDYLESVRGSYVCPETLQLLPRTRHDRN
jgi:hypothetical protein